MINKIVLNEENYKDVLKKLQVICDKYRMYNIYTVKNLDGVITYSNKSYGKIEKLVEDSSCPEGCRKESLYVKNVSYVGVEEHRIKEAYDNKIAEKWDIRMYEEYKPLIFLDLGNGGTLTLYEGDIVKIFKNGFTTYTIERIIVNKDKPGILYIHKFFTDYISVIEDLEKEKEKRIKEWEDICSQWNEDALKVFEDLCSKDEIEDDEELNNDYVELCSYDAYADKILIDLKNKQRKYAEDEYESDLEDDEELDNDYVELCSHDANEYFYQLPKDDLEDFAIESGDLEAFNDLQEEDNGENKNKKNDYILPLMSAYNALKRTSNYDE